MWPITAGPAAGAGAAGAAKRTDQQKDGSAGWMPSDPSFCSRKAGGAPEAACPPLPQFPGGRTRCGASARVHPPRPRRVGNHGPGRHSRVRRGTRPCPFPACLQQHLPSTPGPRTGPGHSPPGLLHRGWPRCLPFLSPVSCYSLACLLLFTCLLFACVHSPASGSQCLSRSRASRSMLQVLAYNPRAASSRSDSPRRFSSIWAWYTVRCWALRLSRALSAR